MSTRNHQLLDWSLESKAAVYQPCYMHWYGSLLPLKSTKEKSMWTACVPIWFTRKSNLYCQWSGFIDVASSLAAPLSSSSLFSSSIHFLLLLPRLLLLRHHLILPSTSLLPLFPSQKTKNQPFLFIEREENRAKRIAFFPFILFFSLSLCFTFLLAFFFFSIDVI